MSWMLHISESYPTGRYFSSPWKSSCHKAHSGSFSVSTPRFRKISPLLVQPLISLLMVLGGDFPNDSQLFQDVVGGCHTSIVGFYGTSGAGKTRTIFEIFTRSYGLYFVAADARTLNPGSNDLRSNYAVLGRFKDEATPRECDDYVRVYTTAMILCRLLVFCVLRHAFGEELSCELWLRVQLAPTHYFRHDVFDSLFSKFISKSSTGVTDATQLSERLNLLEPYLDLIWENLNDSLDTIKFNVAFDEAQVLANMFNNFFKSSVERGETRSLLSPISKALSKLLSNSQYHLLHPIFSGTGFSVAHIITQLSSATGKRTLADTLHYNFKSLEEGNVKTYLESVLDLSQLDERILQYTCRWLTGRSRWTVAFVDLLLA